MESIVVTGADGFIGSHLVRYLCANDIRVYAIVIPDSPTRQRIENLENVTIIEGDLNAYQKMVPAIPTKPSALIHLAWIGVSPDKRDSTGMQFKNLDLCLNAVRLAHALGAERFVLPGSTSEYANCGQLVNEKACPSPHNAYSAAKIAVRYLCAALCGEMGVPFIYTVITGVYGADRMDNNVIHYTITQLLNAKRPSYTKLEQLWDYVHIDDVVFALYLILLKGKNGAFYTIGHGDNWPLYNYIFKIRDIIDPTMQLGIGEIPYQDNKQPSSCVDLTTLQKDTGYAPKISFEEGIRGVIEQMVKRSQEMGRNE